MDVFEDRSKLPKWKPRGKNQGKQAECERPVGSHGSPTYRQLDSWEGEIENMSKTNIWRNNHKKFPQTDEKYQPTDLRSSPNGQKDK